MFTFEAFEAVSLYSITTFLPDYAGVHRVKPTRKLHSGYLIQFTGLFQIPLLTLDLLVELAFQLHKHI